jgi:cobalt-precorrin-6B (C15)-methyltransferase
MNSKEKIISHGIRDEEFIRGKAPMTKREIRSISISKLEIREGDKILDIGAGTGSISIEIGRILVNGTIYAVEKKEEAFNLIKKNIEKFELKNIELIKGEAPGCIKDIEKINRIFIGGSSGNMKEIIFWAKNNIKKEGKIVVNTICIENTYKSIKYLEECNFNNIELVQVSCSKNKKIGNVNMMKALNPINIISAER